MKENLALGLLVLVGITMFPGCYDSIEVDDQSYVIAIGIDKGEISPIKMTLQYANANAMSPSGSGGSGGNGGNVLNATATATTVSGGLSRINSFVGKELDVSHALLIVFSEDMAKSGIGKYMYGLTRNRDFRPTMYVAVCRGSAEKYIKSIIPIQEADPSKYYQLLFTAFSHTGYSINSNVFKFYTAMESGAIQQTANLVGVNKFNSSKEFNDDASTYKEKGHIIPFGGDYKAGDLPRIGDIKGELMGLAIFDGDKLVGELDGEASMIYLMLTGEFGRANLTIPDPRSPGDYVVLNVKQSRKPSSEIKINSSNPQIHTKLKLEGDITVIQSGYNYEDLKKLEVLEAAVETFLKKDIERLVNITINKYGTDIFGFGKEVKKKFLTIKEWENYAWLSKYKDSTFSIDVNMSIRRPGLKLRTMPLINSKGREEENTK